MLYVDRYENGACTIVDSDTGESFITVKHGYEFYRDGEPFEMRHILGYLKSGYVAGVSKHLMYLLSYINDISVASTKEPLNDAIIIGSQQPCLTSKDNIFLKFVGIEQIYSVLDLVMIVSYVMYFPERLKSGVLKIGCGVNGRQYIVVSFCGEYVGCIGKLMTLYRESSEFSKKMAILMG